MRRFRGISTAADLADDRARALAITPVSRETGVLLDRFVDLLLMWQATTNLIAASTIPTLWTRHIADSLQLIDLMPTARAWVDLGSGAGLPGLVVACALHDVRGATVHLVESNAKKAAFLREAQRTLAVPARVHAGRIAEFVNQFEGPAEVVTARAVAPLKSLLGQCFPLLGKNGATGLFPKGQRAELELREAARVWALDARLIPSRTDSTGRIVMIRSAKRVDVPT